MLRPEIDLGGVGVGRRARAQAVEHLVREGVEGAETLRSLRVDAERLVVRRQPVGKQLRADHPPRGGERGQRGALLLAVALDDEIGCVDAHLELRAPPCSNGGVPKPPGVARSAISLWGLRAGATISSATR